MFRFAPLFVLLSFISCSTTKEKNTDYSNSKQKLAISKKRYKEQLYGFWLGQCIANWTGLVTEMDKIGNIGEFKTGDFYTRNDWGKPDQPSIWGQGIPSDLSPTIDFVFEDSNYVWGSDDDTDIEYIYQHLLYINKTSLLTGNQIRDGWLKHIKPEEENFLWVSNQKAFDLMQNGMIPPETGNPNNNEHYDMIDAQLTTEIFGLFAPGRPDIALKIANLPIQTTAREHAAFASEFYVSMYSLASIVDTSLKKKDQILWMASKSKKCLPESSYTSKMYDFVLKQYQAKLPWEQTRDSLYIKYQVNEEDKYDITSRKLYCNGCFASGINFAASLVSLFYGEGDLKKTIKIGTLCGWDSDNPTATWGGLLGFMMGKEQIEKAFGRSFSNKFNIHRTRIGFKNNGIDTFESMTDKGIKITERVIKELMNGKIDSTNRLWILPKP